MEALRIISDEHQSLAAILHAMHFMLKEIKAGRLKPDLKLFRAMVHYLDAYPEQRHHPNEERYLFPRIRARTSEGAAALAELAIQHAGSTARMDALNSALAKFEKNPDQVVDFSTAFDTYADFYRNHMMLEEKEVLPLARKYLTPEDWAEVEAGFLADADPMRGSRDKPEDFAAVFSRLVAAAPAPIGLGAGPYEP